MTQPPNGGWNPQGGPFPPGQPQGGYPGAQMPPPGYYPPPAPQQPQAPQTTNGLAIAALILGVLPLCGGILGVVFGFVALSQIKKSRQKGRGLAITGIVVGALWVVAGIVAVVVINANDHGSPSTFGTLPAPMTLGTQPTSSTVGVFSSKVQVGDCISSLDLSAQDSSGASTVGDPDVVSCTSAHHAEVFDKFTITATSLPSDAELEKLGNTCVERLKAYAPTSYSDPAIDVKYIYPLPRTWAQGDRTIACVATTATTRTESLKGR